MSNIKKTDFELYKKELFDYMDQDFFSTSDRKVAFLVGRYYSLMAYYEKDTLNTASLTTKLPGNTKRIDKERIIKIIDKCNDVAKRLESKTKKSKSVWLMREISDLIAANEWKSKFEELSLAFMMGYTFFSKKIKKNND